MFMAESFVANTTKLTHDNILTNRNTIQGGGRQTVVQIVGKTNRRSKTHDAPFVFDLVSRRKNGRSGSSFRRPSIWIVSLPFQIFSPFPQDMTNVMGKRSPRIEK